MCGIAGIVSTNVINPKQLQSMASIQKHRGPNDEGYTLFAENTTQHYKGDDTVFALENLPHISTADKNSKVGFSHRRLSILDLSEKGHQPMQREEWGLTICYNGEVYNYKEIRATLEQHGFLFQSDCDTEVILAAWKHWGPDCVEQFVGMWAFAIYDKENNWVWLSRDRFGIKPLYYFKDKNQLAFSSEIKAILPLQQKAKLNEKVALEYLAYGTAANPNQTLFANVSELETGCNVQINLNDLSTKLTRYYSLKDAIQNTTLKGSNHVEHFHQLFDESIDLHLRSDTGVGACLSGGNDSSYITALAAKKTEGSFNTFTAAYPNESVDESNYAKQVAQSISNIKDFYCNPSPTNYFNQIEKLIWHQDLPINSTSAFAQWSVMELAQQQNTKVLLDGQGADEALGGYYNFAGIYLIEQLKKFQFGSYSKNRKLLEQNFNPNMETAMKRAGYYFLPTFLQQHFRKKERLGQNLINPDLANNIEVPQRGGKSFQELSLNSIYFSLRQLLRYEDRNSMAFSIESRVPFLHHKLVEYSIVIPNKEKIQNGYTKHILRKASEPYLPKSIVWRKDKLGFVTPQEKWKNELSPKIKEYILSSSIPSILNKNYLTKICETELRSPSQLSEFYKVFAFIKWAEVFKLS